jgi:hypothetical protein
MVSTWFLSNKKVFLSIILSLVWILTFFFDQIKYIFLKTINSQNKISFPENNNFKENCFKLFLPPSTIMFYSFLLIKNYLTPPHHSPPIFPYIIFSLFTIPIFFKPLPISCVFFFYYSNQNRIVGFFFFLKKTTNKLGLSWGKII